MLRVLLGPGSAATFGLLLLFSQPSFPQRAAFSTIQREVIEARFEQNTYGNGKRQKRLTTLFEEAGCQEEDLIEQKVKESRLPNVICTLSGRTDSVIVVGAHYDATRRSSGAVDNWSGAALLASLYQSLRDDPRNHTFRFIGFTDEEKGLIGSTAYVENLTSQEMQATRAMVNLDTLGLTSTKVWVSRADTRLVDLLDHVGKALGAQVEGVNVEKVGSTDSEPFRERQIPSITIHSLTQETLHIPHTPKDKPKALNRDHYYESFRLICAYLAILDQALPNGYATQGYSQQAEPR